MQRSVEDLTGKRFGQLVVLEEAGIGISGRQYLCRCDCGVEKPVSVSGLKRGTKSCGCLRLKNRRKKKTQNREIAGQKFGKLTAVKPLDDSKLIWFCECDCGGSKEVTVHNLRSGGVKSCGCLKRGKKAD